MSHLTVSQRYTIETMLQKGYSNIEIARCIGKHKSVISREIKRNSDKRSGEYRSQLAQKKYEERKNGKTKSIRFTPEMQSKVEALIREEYSPEQVHGYLTRNGESCVSHECIYQHIWKDKRKGGTLHTHLRNKGRRYRKRGVAKDTRGVIPNRVSIEKRPKEALERTVFGHLEVDLIIGKNHEQAIVTLNDIASGAFKMKKVENKKATTVSFAINELLEDWEPYIKSITADNGKEFAAHELVTQQYLIDFYFAHPYSPWERGANENLNGLIRQYFPKSSDFSILTPERIKEVENRINNRPRKRFDFKNPIFVMNQLLFNQKLHL